MATGKTRDVEREEVGERERFVAFLRHGIAESAAEGQTDDARSLTPEGHALMKQIGRGLERVLPRVQAIVSSPLLRATQTALWVAKAYRARSPVRTAEALSPSASVEDFLAFVAALPERRVVLVGHEPTLTRNLRVLIGANGAANIALETGACYGVRIHGDGTAVLEWLLPPRILLKLAEE